MSIVETIEEQTLCDVLTSNAVAPETDEGANGQHECAAYFQNFFTERHGRNTLQIGRAIGDLATRLFALTGGFPKRVGEDLFCRTENHEVRWLANVQSLFAWIDNQAKVNWAKGSDKVPQERFYAHLAMTAEAFDAVELVPHWPPMPGVYYLHPPLPPATDGHHFEELLRQFSPASPEDAALLRAFFLSLFWGGAPGTRPAWLFTGADDNNADRERGRGIGKSTLVTLAGLLAGGYIEVSPTEDIVDIKKRLLSPEARHFRMVRLDNLKTHRFSWGDLEALITSPVISGHQMYRGEGRRPNTLTWAITLNGASLSMDMAQRCMIVQLARPNYDEQWEQNVSTFIQNHRWQIISDIGGILQSQEVHDGL